jgi:hypothetical protein
MNLELTDDEVVLLHRVLENYLPALREEVYKTEKFEWRESLKQDEVLLKSLIARLESAKSRANA